MRPRSAFLLLPFVIALPVHAQDHQHPAPEKVGHVDFAVTCTPAAQAEFGRAVAMLHSFWFDAAESAFTALTQLDPACGMAHWGLAMTYLGNPLTGQNPTPALLERGLAAGRRAVELTARASHREQMYARAALALYENHEQLDIRARLRAHAEAMRALHQMHGDDNEATIFHARALIATAPASDLEFKQQKEAAALLEPLFAKYPNHPGLAHYIIHAFDSPALAKEGARAAFAYADIAPSAPHALHMPSHIFTRLGYWDESIATNDKSAKAEPNPNAAVHPLDYMVYAFLQQGRVADAHAVVRRIVQLEDRFYSGTIGYNFAAMPARYALERNAWHEAAQLPAVATGPAFVQAVTRFARGIGAARAGNAAAARAEIAALEQLRDALRAQNDPYWPVIVEAQRLAVAAWVARAERNDAEALRLAAQAADLEESVEKHPVTPGPLLPARELYGDLLAELGRFADARAAYEKNLVREPRRARSLFGAARAAERAGDRAGARAHYETLLDVMKKADADRPEVQQARAFLAQR